SSRSLLRASLPGRYRPEDVGAPERAREPARLACAQADEAARLLLELVRFALRGDELPPRVELSQGEGHGRVLRPGPDPLDPDRNLVVLRPRQPLADGVGVLFAGHDPVELERCEVPALPRRREALEPTAHVDLPHARRDVDRPRQARGLQAGVIGHLDAHRVRGGRRGRRRDEAETSLPTDPAPIHEPHVRERGRAAASVAGPGCSTGRLAASDAPSGAAGTTVMLRRIGQLAASPTAAITITPAMESRRRDAAGTPLALVRTRPGTAGAGGA